MTAELQAIADAADVIVSGYSFKRNGDIVSILNLNRPHKAARMTLGGEMLETSMDDIELSIVREHLARCLKYMEA